MKNEYFKDVCSDFLKFLAAYYKHKDKGSIISIHNEQNQIATPLIEFD